jgi:hypothetical protein
MILNTKIILFASLIVAIISTVIIIPFVLDGGTSQMTHDRERQAEIDEYQERTQINDGLERYTKMKYFHGVLPIGEFSAHTSTVESTVYPAHLKISHSFQSFRNVDSESKKGLGFVPEYIEFEVYVTKWNINGTTVTNLADTWSYHSKDHLTKYESDLNEGDFVTWQYVPIALDKPALDWGQISLNSVIRYEFTEIIE